MKKGTHTIEQRALLKRINELKLSKVEKAELKRWVLLLIKMGESK